MTVDQQCGSGLMAIAIAAKQVVADGMAVTIGGGVESISLVQNAHKNTHHAQHPWLAVCCAAAVRCWEVRANASWAPRSIP